MNTRCYMVIIKGEIKTSEIMSCGYNRNTQKWDVKFNNGKTYYHIYGTCFRNTGAIPNQCVGQFS